MEFISVDPQKCDISKGKGYNEMILIEDALAQSRFIHECGAFFKVTGRYPIYNLSEFISEAALAINNGRELYCDVKDHKIYDWLKLGWTGHSFECRLFGCTTEFFRKYFWPHVSKCNDYEGRLLENVLFEALTLVNVPVVDRFRREPHFGGVAGHQIDAISFSQRHDDFKSKLKRTTGNGIRIFLPWLKF